MQQTKCSYEPQGDPEKSDVGGLEKPEVGGLEKPDTNSSKKPFERTPRVQEILSNSRSIKRQSSHKIAAEAGAQRTITQRTQSLRTPEEREAAWIAEMEGDHVTESAHGDNVYRE